MVSSRRLVAIIAALLVGALFLLVHPHAYARTLWEMAQDPVKASQSVTVSVRVLGPTKDELLAATAAQNKSGSTPFQPFDNSRDQLSLLILAEAALIGGFFYTVHKGYQSGHQLAA